MYKNELSERLDKAYSWLAKIPVTDEAVDHMAMARQELRAAFRLVQTLPEKKEENADG